MEQMKEIMSQEELEGYFNVTTNTVQEWRKNGLRMSKIGRKNYYMADSVREFFKDMEVCEYERR